MQHKVLQTNKRSSALKTTHKSDQPWVGQRHWPGSHPRSTLMESNGLRQIFSLCVWKSPFIKEGNWTRTLLKPHLCKYSIILYIQRPQMYLNRWLYEKHILVEDATVYPVNHLQSNVFPRAIKATWSRNIKTAHILRNGSVYTILITLVIRVYKLCFELH